jgi:hypothetical protein
MLVFAISTYSSSLFYAFGNHGGHLVHASWIYSMSLVTDKCGAPLKEASRSPDKRSETRMGVMENARAAAAAEIIIFRRRGFFVAEFVAPDSKAEGDLGLWE